MLLNMKHLFLAGVALIALEESAKASDLVSLFVAILT